MAALSILSFCSRGASQRSGIQDVPEAAPKRDPAMEAMESVSPPLLAAHDQCLLRLKFYEAVKGSRNSLSGQRRVSDQLPGHLPA